MKPSDWTVQTIGAASVAAVVMGLFGFGYVWALMEHVDKLSDTLNGVLLTSFGIVVKWFYDSSASSHVKDSTIAQMAANTETALLSTPPEKGTKP